MIFAPGNPITWTSGLGTLTGVIRSINPGKNAAGEVIDWAIIDFKNPLSGKNSNVCLPLNPIGIATMKIVA